jgi:hypothetical protein
MKIQTVLALSLALIFGTVNATAPDPIPTITKNTVLPNPTGMALGFVENGKQSLTLSLMGKRPASRVSTDVWNQIEKTKGVYTWPVTNAGLAHQYGSDVVHAVNVSFAGKIIGAGAAIPSPMYSDDITNATTRLAAKKFVYAYTRHLLKTYGAANLAIDYGVVTNWKLNQKDATEMYRASTWGTWYLEAAGQARQAAIDLGMSDKLRLVVAVDADPTLGTSPVNGGPLVNQWLVNAVSTADSIGVVTYASIAGQPVTSAQHTIDVVKFWIDNFAGYKPVLVLENGFSTATSADSAVTRETRQMKYTGTEADQAAYYTNLFAMMTVANKSGGAWKNQVRSFIISGITDNTAAIDFGDRYLGVTRADGSVKPGGTVARTRIITAEADPVLQPFTLSTAVDVTSDGQGGGVEVNYTSGNSYEYLNYSVKANSVGKDCVFQGTLSVPGTLIMNVNGLWLTQTLKAGHFIFGLPNCAIMNSVDLYATSAVLPFKQHIADLKLIVN